MGSRHLAGVGIPGHAEGPSALVGGGDGPHVFRSGTVHFYSKCPDVGQFSEQTGVGKTGPRAILYLEQHIICFRPNVIAARLPTEHAARLTWWIGRGSDELRQLRIDQTAVVHAAIGRDRERIAVLVHGLDGLLDECPGFHAEVGNRVEFGAVVVGFDHDNLHIPGNFPDFDPIAPLFDDESYIIITRHKGRIPD